ncbi:NUDIX domain-containing protein [Streptomyces iconiensis]|uniref:NUDIX domain-containing protein n=2 Tax=Streptomyces iconiensis TaxID=1384038 RepID=A0ABT7A510_9ACTN|nr:NUDIX domain-containing protein [Streptomyces iconiensis]MDJ1136432.1 NUDIX domain-containing protein [Streptomyces iconiensis]
MLCGAGSWDKTRGPRGRGGRVAQSPVRVTVHACVNRTGRRWRRPPAGRGGSGVAVHASGESPRLGRHLARAGAVEPRIRPSSRQPGGVVRPWPHAIGAHLVFERGRRVLLGRRAPGAAFAPDTWHLPAGHVEDESVRACAVREAYEELGFVLDEPDLELVHTVHVRGAGAGEPRLQLFFRVHRWSGEPQLREPDRCREWAWWPRAALPCPVVGYARTALEGIAQGWTYTSVGWSV